MWRIYLSVQSGTDEIAPNTYCEHGRGRINLQARVGERESPTDGLKSEAPHFVGVE